MSDVDLLRQPVPVAVSQVCLELVAAARAEEQKLDDPAADDALHDFRVSLRRLRSALRSWREPLGKSVRPRERRALRELQRATGAARDAEVALVWLGRQRGRCAPEHAAGMDWLTGRCSAELARTRALLSGELRADFRTLAERLEKRLARTPAPGTAPRFGDALAEAAASATQELVERLVAITGAADEKQMHAARIACKRLRYLLEPVRASATATAGLLETCKSLQTLLGELNDAVNLARALDSALAESAAARATRVSELLRAGFGDRARRQAWFTEWPGLIELAQILGAERAALFARLQSEWLEPGPGPLRAQTQALVAELRARLDGHAEIERKFLLRELPSLDGRRVSSVLIEQGWLSGEEPRERIRVVSDGAVSRYYRTLKLGTGRERTELETEIGPEMHAELWPRTLGCRLRKRRHRLAEGALCFEVDEFLDRDLVLAEVELPAQDTPLCLPDWLAPHVAREVTGEPEYTGSGLGR